VYLDTVLRVVCEGSGNLESREDALTHCGWKMWRSSLYSDATSSSKDGFLSLYDFRLRPSTLTASKSMFMARVFQRLDRGLTCSLSCSAPPSNLLTWVVQTSVEEAYASCCTKSVAKDESAVSSRFLHCTQISSNELWLSSPACLCLSCCLDFKCCSRPYLVAYTIS
jgi:hypothetical protein